MPKTISFHNGTSWSRGHNIRDERYTSNQEHIDKSLSKQNVIIRDVPVRQAYEEIFGQAVQEYNSRQKRKDRKIDCYYDKIKQDKRKHPVYECIVQIGDKNDTGNSAELEKQALIRFAEEWEERNPNLYLIGAYIHADEPNGTVHLHCDYIPVAECSRGMKIQNSYDKALQQQGFKSENIHQTAQIAWQESEREALTAICRDFFIDAQHSQGIGKGRKYLTPQEYRRAKDEQQAKIEEELQPLKDELSEYKQLDVSEKAFVLDEKKVLFQKRISVPIDELEKLKEQAKAYRVNQTEIKLLRKRKQELEQKAESLKHTEQELQKKQALLESRQQAIETNHQTVKRMYDRQRNLNKLLESAEEQISALITENSTLSQNIDDQNITIQMLRERFRGAYETLTDVIKAIGMLEYDNNGEYKADLTPTQTRLIEAVTNYSINLAKASSQLDLAEKMENKIGISQGIQNIIDDLTPRQSRGIAR
ncbi:MAG: plasmid recombination protein [Ruminococcus sp.]|nr:plasmid recombination protein [Ruminococcus sp.]